jgi:hypothetical protein
MMLSKRRYFSHLLLLAIVAAACTDRNSLTDPRRLLPQQPGKDISDGAHVDVNGHLGNGDVFFLPPMVKNPNQVAGYGDPFQPGLPVSFRITDQSTTAVVQTLVATTDLTNQFYGANWDTKAIATDLSHIYRISVVIKSKAVAYADVKFGANGASLKNLDTDDFVGLVDGRTLPIKVRIEQGWDCLDKTSCVTEIVPNTIPAGKTVIVSTGGTLPNSVEFSPSTNGTWATNVDGTPIVGPIVVTIQDVTGVVTGGCGNGLNLQLSQNHCIKITTDPAVKLTSRVRVGICFANPGDDRQLLLKYDTDPGHIEAPRFLENAPPPVACPVEIGSATIHSSNPLVRFAATVTSRIGRGVNWALGVKPAYAFDAGGGGFIGIGDGFSLFAAAFPQQLSAFGGDAQQAIQGQQVGADLVVDLSYIHDANEEGLSPHVTGASLTCTAVTPGANFTASHVPSVAATELGNGRYSCGRPFVSQTLGSNQFTVTANGFPDGVLFDTGDETIQLTGTVTFNAQSILSPIAGVSINPSSLNLQIGDEPVLNATVTLREGSEASTAVNWSLVSTAPNGVIDFKPASNATEVIANALGTATLRATSTVDPTKFADVTVVVTPSFQGSISEGAGDVLGGGNAADLVSASLNSARGSLDVVVGFTSGGLTSAVDVALSLDTDQNPETGYRGIDGGNVRDAGVIGVDYLLQLGSGADGQARLLRYTNSFSTVRSYPITVVGNEIHVSVPLSDLGNPQRPINFVVTSDLALDGGGFTAILDVMPSITTGQTTGPIGSTAPTVPRP